MSDDRASPKPWTWFRGELQDANGREVVQGRVWDAHENLLHGFVNCSEADGELIVRAVNHHDELVAALDGLCDADADSDARYYHDNGRDSVCSRHGFSHFDTCPSEGCVAVRERLSEARALLARIKGGK